MVSHETIVFSINLLISEIRKQMSVYVLRKAIETLIRMHDHLSKVDLFAQNLSFLKKKSTAGCFSFDGSGLLYLYENIKRLETKEYWYLPVSEDSLDLVL